MGAQCSFICAQSSENKSVEVFDKFRRTQTHTAKNPNDLSIDSDESIILDPVEVLTKSLIRRFLILKYFRAIPLFKSFLEPGIVIYGPPETNAEIEKLEKTIPPFREKRITAPAVENFSTVFLYEGGCYSGQWDISQQKPDGFGVMVYTDNSKYIGDFKSGKRSGKGRFLNLEGDIYEGDFYNDRMQGQGKLKRSNGTAYKGGFSNNFQHGEGVLEYMGKVVYSGSYVKGMKHGHGKLVMGGNVYVGDFNTDLMDGNGIYTWADGKNYNGGWKANKMHGFGTYKWADGKLYVGYFVDGIREGLGSFKWTDGREYKGGWSKGKMHGEGSYLYIDKGKKRNFVAIYEFGKRKKILRY